MTKQYDSKSSKYTYQDVLTTSTDELKAIFEDDDIERLEYPAGEFPQSETQIIIIFSEQSGKEPQYIELEDWLDFLKDYRESQQQQTKILPKKPFEAKQLEHEEEFVCIVSFRINGDEEQVGEVVVSPEDRDNCVNDILEKYPNEQLDFSIEFMCKRCFQDQLSEEMIESEVSSYGSKMIH